MNRWMGGWIDGWVGGWKDGWMNGWINGSLNGWVTRKLKKEVNEFRLKRMIRWQVWINGWWMDE